MSDTLIGVLVGGFIASALPALSLAVEYKKWRRDRRLNHLKAERDRLEKIFGDLRPQVADAVASGVYDVNMAGVLIFRCPQRVEEAFSAMSDEMLGLRTEANSDSDHHNERARYHFHRIIAAMHGELAELDEQIAAESM
jgi:hypothetical protein